MTRGRTDSLSDSPGGGGKRRGQAPRKDPRRRGGGGPADCSPKWARVLFAPFYGTSEGNPKESTHTFFRDEMTKQKPPKNTRFPGLDSSFETVFED